MSDEHINDEYRDDTGLDVTGEVPTPEEDQAPPDETNDLGGAAVDGDAPENGEDHPKKKKRTGAILAGLGIAVLLGLGAGAIYAANTPSTYEENEPKVSQVTQTAVAVTKNDVQTLELQPILESLSYKDRDVSFQNENYKPQVSDGAVVVSYFETATGAEAVTKVAQRSRALAHEIDADKVDYVTMVATDANGKVLAAVTNEAGADTEPETDKELLEESAGYCISKPLYETVENPNYEAESETAPKDVMGNEITPEERVEDPAETTPAVETDKTGSEQTKIEETKTENSSTTNNSGAATSAVPAQSTGSTSGADSGSASSNNSASDLIHSNPTKPTETPDKKPEHQHKWVDKTERKWVENKIWVVDSPAWTETQQVRIGSKVVFSDGYVINNVKPADIRITNYLDDHDVSYRFEDMYESKTIQHEATGHYEDKGYYQTVTVGKTCASCGQSQ
jgi:23S rRNA maturation mini-RNase III